MSIRHITAPKQKEAFNNQYNYYIKHDKTTNIFKRYNRPCSNKINIYTQQRFAIVENPFYVEGSLTFMSASCFTYTLAWLETNKVSKQIELHVLTKDNEYITDYLGQV